MVRRTFRLTVALLAVVALPSVPGALGGETSGGLGISSVAAVTPADDGGWWVLERSLQGFGGLVYKYDDGWRRTDERHRLTLGDRREFSPTDLVRADGGGWWVLDHEGTVYRFSANWSTTGERYALSDPDSGYNVTSAYGLTRRDDGGWWAAAGRDLVSYDADWSSPVRAETTGGTSEGYPVATLRERTDSLLVLEGYLGTGVSRYALETDGREGGPRISGRTAGYGLHDVVDAPVDVDRRGDRFLVVDADGQVHQFDPYWRYTGATHPVGSGTAVASYPSDVIVPGFILLSIVARAIWFVPALVTAVGALAHYRRSGRHTGLLGGTLAVGFLYGIVVVPFAARPVAFASPYLPLLLALAALLLPASQVARVRDRRDLFVPLLVTYAPTFVAATMLLGPALRPL